MVERIFNNLEFEPLRGQILLVNALAAFTNERSPYDVFVINGYAGTGKSSVIGAYVKALVQTDRKVVLLAPTGRAAKVVSQFAGIPAYTIHKRIFRADSNGAGSRFFPIPNLDKDTIFIADEASLISDNLETGDSLLRQLIRHVYSGERCNLILVGDSAQLPPVGQPDSPAINSERLREIGLNPIRFTLDQPVRQADDSGILANADIMRKAGQILPDVPPVMKLNKYDDIQAISSAELAEYLSDSWDKVGTEETLIITRSNKRANKFNQAIRNLIMQAERPIERGDRLIISKNDYYWSKLNKLPQFIANGETAIVDHVGATEKKYGRYFTDVELTFPSDGSKIEAKVHLRSLISEGPAIPSEEMNRFYNHVLAEMEGKSLSEQIKAANEDPWYNSLQAKYAYCVTCHKAQGGQWKHVYIDMGNIDTSELTEDFYRWIYTALTRATEKVFLINPTLQIK